MSVSDIARTTCWVVSDGKMGMENQCRALAEALALDPVVKRIAIRPPWRWLPPQMWRKPLAALDTSVGGGDHFARPWPDLVIATGRQTVAPVLALKRAAGRSRPILCVQLQDPKVDPARFDLVIVPGHDRIAGDNVVATLGAMHRVTPAVLADAAAHFGDKLAQLPRPRIAVLLGGGNRAYKFTDRAAEALGGSLARLADSAGAGLMVTPSRRTPARALARIAGHLDGRPAAIWDEADPNPYFGYLALADAIVVTADSVNMVSEAAGTGKPVYIAALVGGSRKFRRFHAAMADAGITRPFDGRLDDWQYTPPDDTARAAAAVHARLATA